MKVDWGSIDLKELAAVVPEQLRKGGVEVLLVGESCVSLYTENRYLSYDLDFITHSSLREIEPRLGKIGFQRKSTRHFSRDDCPFFIEFVAPPAAIGNEPVREKAILQTKSGRIVMLTPTDCVKDRLAAWYHWKDPQSLEQALLVAASQKVKLTEVRRWSAREGFKERYRTFEKRLKISASHRGERRNHPGSLT
ncbi:MAG: hypothetical protein ACYC9Y_05970 [Candidatus Methylomirabilia bacterium]